MYNNLYKRYRKNGVGEVFRIKRNRSEAPDQGQSKSELSLAEIPKVEIRMIEKALLAQPDMTTQELASKTNFSAQNIHLVARKMQERLTRITAYSIEQITPTNEEFYEIEHYLIDFSGDTISAIARILKVAEKQGYIPPNIDHHCREEKVRVILLQLGTNVEEIKLYKQDSIYGLRDSYKRSRKDSKDHKDYWDRVHRKN